MEDENIHVSGPTGVAKSDTIESFAYQPENFKRLCKALGCVHKPITYFPVEMSTFESPAEVHFRRGFDDKGTFDEFSPIVKALSEAQDLVDDYYCVIHCKEMGRTLSSTIQGSLLNLMSAGIIELRDGTRLSGKGIRWITDSNYQASEGEMVHTLSVQDDALKRRYPVNLTMNYLSLEEEIEIVDRITRKQKGKGTEHRELCISAVKLGHRIRKEREEGNILSAVPPTIQGYISFINYSRCFPYLEGEQVANVTLLGNICNAEKAQASSICNEVFGLADFEDEEVEETGGSTI